jgi:hypothetical protein
MIGVIEVTDISVGHFPKGIERESTMGFFDYTPSGAA